MRGYHFSDDGAFSSRSDHNRCTAELRRLVWARMNGVEFSPKGLREARGGGRVAVFASATVVNIVVALGLAVVLFGSFSAES